MTWWWEFFDERNLTPYFAGVREISDRMLAAGGGDFAEVAVTAGPFTALVIRCGSEIFGYLANSAAAATAVDVVLDSPPPALPTVEMFDPETRTWTAGLGAVPHEGRTILPAVALRPGEARIFVLH